MPRGAHALGVWLVRHATDADGRDDDAGTMAQQGEGARVLCPCWSRSRAQVDQKQQTQRVDSAAKDTVVRRVRRTRSTSSTSATTEKMCAWTRAKQ